MKQIIDFSIIIPHRNSLSLLPRLFGSIPFSDRIEVILVDNSPVPITKKQIVDEGVKRDFCLCYSEPVRGAGGARNVGIEHATGKWLLFIDADDYLEEGAFDIFYNYINSDAEVIYFCPRGVYDDTGEYAPRGENYSKLVTDYLENEAKEYYLRLLYSTPWAKMISRGLVYRYKLRYDEVVASNDTYFAMLVGYYANKILAVNRIVYVVTVSRGSLTRRRDPEVVLSRYSVALRYNQFVKKHKLGKYQKSVMIYFYNARSLGVKNLVKMLFLAFKYKQNLFVGVTRWRNSFKKTRSIDFKEKKYITK